MDQYRTWTTFQPKRIAACYAQLDDTHKQQFQYMLNKDAASYQSALDFAVRNVWRVFVAFGLGKLAVLESKLDIYEDLSQQMLDKLERAVGTISENSNKIAIILERHESRLDESERTDNLIIKMIDELKEQEEKNHQILHERID